MVLSTIVIHGIPKLQALPRDGKPVNKWNDSDDAWEDVAKGIRLVVEELRKR